jgi:hypothetical protein
MKRLLRCFPVFPVVVVAAALALLPRPALASELCGRDGEWSRTLFGDGRGKTVTDLQEIHEPAPRGTWRIDCGKNGSAQLSAWDKEEVLICAQVTAWSPNQSRAEALLRSVHVETGGGTLRAEGPQQTNNGRWTVSYRIFAPRRLDLNAKAANGGISLEGIRGRITLTTSNGPIQITDAGGDVRGRTTNGPISVRLIGRRWSGQGLDVETVNGPIHLSIPERFSADLETGTRNGPLEMAFPVTVRGRMPKRFRTVLGEGGPPIRVVTSNGPVVLDRPDSE